MLKNRISNPSLEDKRSAEGSNATRGGIWYSTDGTRMKPSIFATASPLWSTLNFWFCFSNHKTGNQYLLGHYATTFICCRVWCSIKHTGIDKDTATTHQEKLARSLCWAPKAIGKYKWSSCKQSRRNPSGYALEFYS